MVVAGKYFTALGFKDEKNVGSRLSKSRQVRGGTDAAASTCASAGPSCVVPDCRRQLLDRVFGRLGLDGDCFLADVEIVY